MNRKAQGQIITTILIILLVLAAIVIVWQVVNRTVTEGTDQIDVQSACLGVTLDIESANATTNEIKVRRNAGGPEENVKIYAMVEGGAKTVGDMGDAGELGTAILGVDKVDVPMEPGDSVKAGVELMDGTVCNPVATTTAAA